MNSSWGNWGYSEEYIQNLLTQSGFEHAAEAYAQKMKGSDLCERSYLKEIKKIEDLEKTLAEDTQEDFEGGNYSFGHDTSPSRLADRREKAKAAWDQCVSDAQKRAAYKNLQKEQAAYLRESRMAAARQALNPEALKGFPPALKFAILGGGILALVGAGIVVWRKVTQ
jgi:hypothetical protein